MFAWISFEIFILSMNEPSSTVSVATHVVCLHKMLLQLHRAYITQNHENRFRRVKLVSIGGRQHVGPHLTAGKMAQRWAREHWKKHWVRPSTRGPSPHAQHGALKTVLVKWANSVITRLLTAPHEAFFPPLAKSVICLCLLTDGWNVLHFKIWSLPRNCLLIG